LLDNHNGDYDIPISLRAGKVVKVGKSPFNIFFQCDYHPAGLQSVPGTEYSFKLSVTPLLPGFKLGPLLHKDDY